MTLLLQYKYQEPNDNLSGPGYTWTVFRETFETRDDLLEELRRLQRQIGEQRHFWEHKDPKWRGAYLPTFKDIKILVMTEYPESEAIVAEARDAYQESYDKAEVQRQRERTESRQQRRAEFKKLQAEFGGGA